MKQKILVVDDDPVLGEIIRETLLDYDVTVNTSGEEGVATYRQGQFDLLICDLVLPGIGGLDVIREVRAHNPDSRVMVISAMGTTENLLATLRESVVDFLVKPFAPDELRGMVASLLSLERAIEVVSATAKWIELRVPASFQIACSLEGYFSNLETDLDENTKKSISIAFRELLNNAIEHGAKGNVRRLIGVSYIRFERAIFYRIQDPGSGFDPGAIPHAAVAHPDDPFKHLEVRQEKGMRAGGYGLLWTQNLVDEVVFNQKRNKVTFVKYLDPPKAAGDASKPPAEPSEK